MSRQFVHILGYIVTLVWVISFILQAATKSYSPPESLNPAFLAVVTAAFAGAGVSQVRGVIKDRAEAKATEKTDA